MFDNQQRAFIALSGGKELCLAPRMANRHGLITGATGTGKTVTLQNLAETFSAMGVPVFAADVKGDLSGVAASGGNKESVNKRVEAYRLQDRGFAYHAFPVQFWDVFGEQGAPVRATIAGMGPLLLGRLLSLNDTQTAVLTVVFRIAADESLELVDLKDLRKLLEYAAANADRYSVTYGNIAAASIGAIQRGLTALEHQGADAFFGEPDLRVEDLLQTRDGHGVINILAADRLMNAPVLYTSFLLWFMTRLFEILPEVGDPEKPKLVFFFDEAHLLFSDAPKVLLEKVEQVVRLIRSKGVGMYFISQTPADIPDSVLGQLGNRVQHALRAYTPKDQKALKAAAQSFRANPAFDTESAIAGLGTGEALVSFLDASGAPLPVERAVILPPQGQIGPLEQGVRKGMVASSLGWRLYSEAKDRTSAYELLSEKMQNTLSPREQAARAREEAARAREQAAKAREEAKARKAEEAARLKAEKEAEAARVKAEKEAQRESQQRTRFWSGVAKSVLVPLARQALSGLFKRR